MILGIPARPGLRVMVASKPIDFRKGMDGLVAMVIEVLAADAFAGDVFIFRSKRTDRLKLIFLGRLRALHGDEAPRGSRFCPAAGAGWCGDAECLPAADAILRNGLDADTGAVCAAGEVRDRRKKFADHTLIF
jgi:hypothetical protein